MLGDRRLPFAVEFDRPCIEPQLRCAEANQFPDESKGCCCAGLLKHWIMCHSSSDEEKPAKFTRSVADNVFDEVFRFFYHLCSPLDNHVAGVRPHRSHGRWSAKTTGNHWSRAAQC
jgi:hypothetical protein